MKNKDDIVIKHDLKTKKEIDIISSKTNLSKLNPIDQQLVQYGEQAEAMEELNKDIINSDTGFSSLDMRGRVNVYEKACFGIHDLVCTSLNCLPRECLDTTRKFLGLSVSLGGKGREELIHMGTGTKKTKMKEGFFKRLFSGREKEEEKEE